eukprot:6184936-Pleurochrysis_carterae.AAC.4
MDLACSLRLVCVPRAWSPTYARRWAIGRVSKSDTSGLEQAAFSGTLWPRAKAGAEARDGRRLVLNCEKMLLKPSLAPQSDKAR